MQKDRFIDFVLACGIIGIFFCAAIIITLEHYRPGDENHVRQHIDASGIVEP